MNRLLETSTPIKYLKGVGEKRALLLAKLGIFTVGDLLYFFPRAYEDRSRLVSIADAVSGEVSCIKATVCLPVSEAKIRKGIFLYKTKVTDGESLMNLTFFNSPYLKLAEGESYDFYGRCELTGRSFGMINPVCEPAGSGNKSCHAAVSPIRSMTRSTSLR